MSEAPDFAKIAALIGDPARANMLAALLSGRALTATELAGEAGVTLQTASSHLSKLNRSGLIAVRKQGRHKYFNLAGRNVAEVLEGLMGLAADETEPRTRPGPQDPALRHARVCYNHLAGDLGVQLFESLRSRGFLAGEDEGLHLTDAGRSFVHGFGIDVAALEEARAPLCRECLDWSERKIHLAGSLGRAFLARFETLGWAERVESTRIVRFSPRGEELFARTFPLAQSL
ncbi:ArsR/SmtB family transcription factor [Amaricoccus macauensis]|uniref:ArsR/SmtB family transcription factor n=1 Tax=Amaricoccus macauensis TaxID=57001 RepID=UPI003C7A57CD